VSGQSTFGEALQFHLKDQGRTYPWLVDCIARLTGRKRMDTTNVTRWVNGEYAPDPVVVFAIEEGLGLAPGTLSRTLGYLPVDAAADLSVPAAVEADPRLTVLGRRVVLKVYEELVADG